jgi:hypothetical protein
MAHAYQQNAIDYVPLDIIALYVTNVHAIHDVHNFFLQTKFSNNQRWI